MRFHTFRYGIQLEAYSGVLVPEDSPIWQMDDTEAMNEIRNVLGQMPYVKAAAAINWFLWALGTDEKRWHIIPESSREEEKHENIVAAMANAHRNAYLAPHEMAQAKRYLHFLAQRKQSQALRRGAIGTLRLQVLERDEYRCRYCGCAVVRKTAHIDHVIPYSLGGLTEIENLATACADCNHMKAGKTLEQAGMALR